MIKIKTIKWIGGKRPGYCESCETQAATLALTFPDGELFDLCGGCLHFATVTYARA